MLFSNCTKYVSQTHWRLECGDGAPKNRFNIEDLQRENIPLSIYSITLMLTTLLLKECTAGLGQFRTDRYRIPVYIYVLLFNIFLQCSSVVSAVMLTLNFQCVSEYCVHAFTAYSTVDLCGLYLHQLVALESVLFLRNPRYTAGFLYLPRSITLIAILYFLAYVCVETRIFLDFYYCLPSVGILIATFVFTFKAPPPQYDSGVKHRETACLVAIVATVTLIVAYLPNLVTMCLVKWENNPHNEHLLNINKITFSMRGIRMFLDTVLCVLICKELLPVHCEKKGLCF